MPSLSLFGGGGSGGRASNPNNKDSVRAHRLAPAPAGPIDVRLDVLRAYLEGRGVLPKKESGPVGGYYLVGALMGARDAEDVARRQMIRAALAGVAAANAAKVGRGRDGDGDGDGGAEEDGGGGAAATTVTGEQADAVLATLRRRLGLPPPSEHDAAAADADADDVVKLLMPPSPDDDRDGESGAMTSPQPQPSSPLLTQLHGFDCIAILDSLLSSPAEAADTDRTLLGSYRDPTLAAWSDIVRSYRRGNVHLSEALDLLRDSVAYDLPALGELARATEAKVGRLDGRRRELDRRYRASCDLYNDTCAEFGIGGAGGGEDVERELADLPGRELPGLFGEVMDELLGRDGALEAAVGYHDGVVRYLFGGAAMGGKRSGEQGVDDAEAEAGDTPPFLTTLRRLLAMKRDGGGGYVAEVAGPSTAAGAGSSPDAEEVGGAAGGGGGIDGAIDGGTLTCEAAESDEAGGRQVVGDENGRLDVEGDFVDDCEDWDIVVEEVGTELEHGGKGGGGSGDDDEDDDEGEASPPTASKKAAAVGLTSAPSGGVNRDCTKNHPLSSRAVRTGLANDLSELSAFLRQRIREVGGRHSGSGTGSGGGCGSGASSTHAGGGEESTTTTATTNAVAATMPFRSTDEIGEYLNAAERASSALRARRLLTVLLLSDGDGYRGKVARKLDDALRRSMDLHSAMDRTDGERERVRGELVECAGRLERCRSRTDGLRAEVEAEVTRLVGRGGRGGGGGGGVRIVLPRPSGG